MIEFTQEQLHSLLHYDPDTGVFTWLTRPASSSRIRGWNTRYAGKEAGSVFRHPDGRVYLRIRIFRKNYFAHRLAWAYMTGAIPILSIDHRDLDGLNNRWRNLRLATESQNAANSNKRGTNTSGFKGVYFDADRKRYRAQIKTDEKRVHLGLFDTPEEAGRAYENAAQQHFGEFARA